MILASGGGLKTTRRNLGSGLHPVHSSISWMEETVGLQGSLQAHHIFTNELLRFTMLAPSCLMGALGQGTSRTMEGGASYATTQKTGTPDHHPQRRHKSILETRQSAAYSSLRRKTRDKQAGDSGFTPPEESALLSQAVSGCFQYSTVGGTYGAPPPHPLRFSEGIGEGS